MGIKKIVRSLGLAAVAMSAIALYSCGKDDSGTPAEPETFYDPDYFTTSNDTVVTGKSSNVTYYSATLTGKINLPINSLPKAAKYGFLMSENDNPKYDSAEIINSKVRSQIYTCAIGGLKMGTRYYYRAYVKLDGKTLKVGRTMYFTTKKCEVETLEPTYVTPYGATVSGKTSINLHDPNFKGEVGVLYTKRETDKPNIEVDKVAVGAVSSEDSCTYSITLHDLSEQTKYLYQAYLKIGDTYYWGQVRSFNTTRLDISTSDKVELGLSVQWAGRNVGATKTSETGAYYCWGDPTGARFTQKATDYPTTDAISGTDKDMATANQGEHYSLPTYEEFQELLKQCDWHWMVYDDVQGYAVTGPSGNSIFLPAGGYTVDGTTLIGASGNTPIGLYWTGNRAYYNGTDSYCLSISTNSKLLDHKPKHYGMNVRAVYRP